ncbi:CBO0543 family protein [Alkalibacillus aidingensis]|uniref:CBO0543 family protein n=1 Tax=Alkalibacillus aidingensis TaxID=2747607 RepID=UPI002948BD13|nr:CBO0543 family protein [Alkalibacillus aidingensis]
MDKYINIGFNIESYLLVSVCLVGLIGLISYLRMDWKRFGLLALASAMVGNVLCFIFVTLDFYTYPYRLFPQLSEMPIIAMTLAVPFLVLLSVRYSPQKWAWKLPFYWVLVHGVMLFESLVLIYTDIIQYEFKWDLWDSYTWWWVYFLFFEWFGGKVIPDHLRKPLKAEHLRFGKIGWVIVHFVLIVTIFLGGYYLGRLQ